MKNTILMISSDINALWPIVGWMDKTVSCTTKAAHRENS